MESPQAVTGATRSPRSVGSVRGFFRPAARKQTTTLSLCARACGAPQRTWPGHLPARQRRNQKGKGLMDYWIDGLVRAEPAASNSSREKKKKLPGSGIVFPQLEGVAQTSPGLPGCRGFPIRRRGQAGAACRLEVGDTAGWKSALRSLRSPALLSSWQMSGLASWLELSGQATFDHTVIQERGQ